MLGFEDLVRRIRNMRASKFGAPGMSLDEIHTVLVGEQESETDIYLAYRAAEILDGAE